MTSPHRPALSLPSRRFLFGLLAAFLCVGSARADIQIHGSTTAYTTTDKDWLSHTTEDIDANGLGTAGWLFFGNFDGVAEAGQPLTHRIESLPPYITAVVAGANFLSVADEYNTENPGFGIIDDPTTLDGSDARSGAVVADGGVAGDSLEIISFTVSGLTTPVRVGILSGTEQRADGRWDPTSITLSDGTASATVGDHTTNPLPFVPDSVTPNNVGWVFFDIDADGTYTISATKRLATQGVSIGGLTFDNTPPETFTFNATIDDDFLYGPNWSGSNGGTATPANMGAADTYVVPVNAMLSGPATLSGNLVVNPAATLTMATGSQIGGTGIVTVNGRLKTSAGGTATIGAALVLHNTGAPGRVLDIVAGSGAGQFDRVLSSGTAELAGALVVDFSDRPLADAGTYTFLTYGGKALSFSSVTPVGLATGTGFAFDAPTQAQFTFTGATTFFGLNMPASFGSDATYVGTTGNYITFSHTGQSEDFIGYKNNTFFMKDSPGGGDTTDPNLVVGGDISGKSFITTSDRNAKDNFAPVSAADVLAKVTALPIQEWNFKDTADVRHIATVDADGVALAAIQGLNQKLTEALKRKDTENAALKQRLSDLEEKFSAIEEMLRPSAPPAERAAAFQNTK